MISDFGIGLIYDSCIPVVWDSTSVKTIMNYLNNAGFPSSSAEMLSKPAAFLNLALYTLFSTSANVIWVSDHV